MFSALHLLQITGWLMQQLFTFVYGITKLPHATSNFGDIVHPISEDLFHVKYPSIIPSSYHKIRIKEFHFGHNFDWLKYYLFIFLGRGSLSSVL